MTSADFELDKLKKKLEEHLKDTNANTVTRAEIQNVKNIIQKFYEDKKELDEKLNILKLNTDVDKVNEQYKQISETLAFFKSCNMEQRLKDIEMDIAILKEGGNI